MGEQVPPWAVAVADLERRINDRLTLVVWLLGVLVALHGGQAALALGAVP